MVIFTFQGYSLILSHPGLLPHIPNVCFLLLCLLLSCIQGCHYHLSKFHQFSSVTQSCLTLRDPMDCSTPGFPVHHQLLELAQTHVHWVGDAIRLSHPLSSPSPPAFNLSQHQGLLQWVRASYQVAKVLELQLQHQSFQWIFGTDFLYNWLVWSPCSPRTLKSLPQHHSLKASILWCSAFFMVQLSQPYKTTGKRIALTRQSFVGKVNVSAF